MSENKVDEQHQLTVDQKGDWVYPSGAATGMVEIVLPAAHGPNSEERLLVKDFGSHVAKEVEKSLTNPYPVSSPHKSATATLRHYLGAAQDAGLMDEQALKRMESLATEFESEPEKQQFFEEVVRPYLLTLAPRRRQS
jgi:hypothetical protein